MELRRSDFSKRASGRCLKRCGKADRAVASTTRPCLNEGRQDYEFRKRICPLQGSDSGLILAPIGALVAVNHPFLTEVLRSKRCFADHRGHKNARFYRDLHKTLRRVLTLGGLLSRFSVILGHQ